MLRRAARSTFMFALGLWSTAGCGDADLGERAHTDTLADSDTLADGEIASAETDTAPDVLDVAPEVEPPPSDSASSPDTDGDADGDAPLACALRPLPFTPPSQPTPWRSLASEAITALGSANHRGQDVIVAVGEPQVLVAKFAYAFVDKDMTCEDVEVWMQREVPCGAWELVGRARTSDNPDDSTECDNHGTRYGIEDDGGRVFFEIPEHARFGVGRYPVRMVLGGDLSVASFDLIVVERGTQAIVTDIDGTLTTGDDELITEVAFAIFNETYEQVAYPDADRMVRAWHDKGYLVVYLTGRPDLLRRMTERWLEPRFSAGPLHLTDTNAQVLPRNDAVGVYKRDYIAHLRQQGLDIVAAYGNATTDIWAYAEAGIPKERTFIIGKHAGEEGTVPLTASYTAHLQTVLAFPAATHPAPPTPSGGPDPNGWW